MSLSVCVASVIMKSPDDNVTHENVWCSCRKSKNKCRKNADFIRNTNISSFSTLFLITHPLRFTCDRFHLSSRCFYGISFSSLIKITILRITQYGPSFASNYFIYERRIANSLRQNKFKLILKFKASVVLLFVLITK